MISAGCRARRVRHPARFGKLRSSFTTLRMPVRPSCQSFRRRPRDVRLRAYSQRGDSAAWLSVLRLAGHGRCLRRSARPPVQAVCFRVRISPEHSVILKMLGQIKVALKINEQIDQHEKEVLMKCWSFIPAGHLKCPRVVC